MIGRDESERPGAVLEAVCGTSRCVVKLSLFRLSLYLCAGLVSAAALALSAMSPPSRPAIRHVEDIHQIHPLSSPAQHHYAKLHIVGCLLLQGEYTFKLRKMAMMTNHGVYRWIFRQDSQTWSSILQTLSTPGLQPVDNASRLHKYHPAIFESMHEEAVEDITR